ncbi:LPS translocon maturation chaperone LptM [Microvirga terricola]|uniref:Lipoprotein n=1 Tax=Microvirga terricola TaxID=2719797 RepID=A0ABX0VI71_9HYPH|nr:lipoprotein [Microvirga terricola]NIX78192.1 lipoprotein [Microvirga terricola]
MSPRLVSSRAVLVAGLLVLSLSACGRRGALEPPPDPSAPTAQQGAASGSEDESALPSPVGTQRKKVNRAYKIPDQPFILDPLL